MKNEWLSGTSTPIEKQFNKSLNIYALQSMLATMDLLRWSSLD